MEKNWVPLDTGSFPLLIIVSFTFRQTIRVTVSPCIFLRVRGLSLFFAVNHHYASTLPGHYQHATSPPSTIVNHYGGASPNRSPNIGRSSSAENMSPQHTKVRKLSFSSCNDFFRLFIQVPKFFTAKKIIKTIYKMITNIKAILLHFFQTPPTVRRRPPYGTLPSSAPSSASNSHRKPPVDHHYHPRSASTTPRSGTTTPVAAHHKKPSRFASFGKGLFKLRSGRWSSSAPDLGDQRNAHISYFGLFTGLEI